jgi:hypothetical protein
MSAKRKTQSKKHGAKTAAARSKSSAAPSKASGKRTKATQTQTQREAKPKRLSALDAAAQVLKASGKPMRAQELIAKMTEQGLWTSPKGKTPHATLAAAMYREINAKGDHARFTMTDRGQFAFNKEAKG